MAGLPKSLTDIQTTARESDKVSEKTSRSFDRIEQMPPALRNCVHEFGEPIVTACLLAGVREPRRIRQLVKEIWEGARHPTQRRQRLGTLDWILTQAGAQINAKTLIRILRDNSYYLVPNHPTQQMIDASMKEVANFDLRITKTEKHRLRLVAAIAAGVKHLWPDIE